MNRVAEVNQAIRKEFGTSDMKLYRGHGYYYVSGGVADHLCSQSIAVYRASDLTVKEWMDQIRSLFREYLSDFADLHEADNQTVERILNRQGIKLLSRDSLAESGFRSARLSRLTGSERNYNEFSRKTDSRND